ncbi:MAG: ABC transporter ATP-binding protein [Myxococcota bacterium]
MAEAVHDDSTQAPREPDASTITITSGIASLFPFARGAVAEFVGSAALAAVATLLGLAPYWVIYRSVDHLVSGGPDSSALYGLAALALGAIVLRHALLGVSIYVSHIGAYRVLYEIRLALAGHLARVPLGTVTRRRSGEIKKVMGDDVERLELFLAHGIPDAVAGLVTLLAIAAWMLWVDWRVGFAAIFMVVPAFGSMSIAMRNASRHMGDYQSSMGDMNASIVELIRGMPVVKVFNRASDQVRGTEAAVRRYVETVRSYSLDFLPFGTAFYVLLAANVLAIVPIGGWLWIEGDLSTTDLLFFFIVGLGALAPLVSLLHLFANLSHLTSGGNLVREIMDAAVLEEAGEGGVPADGAIEFRDVSFSYDQRRVIEELSFRIAPGTMTALVGPSGSGKSTVASLLARFWDVEAGAISIGGVDVRRLSNETLTRHVSMVLQDTFLFDDSIAGNLRAAKPDATDDELEAAARLAQAHAFIERLPEGYETPIGEFGAKLSGGERQRLAIARAILADTPVIVLDEATAFSDPENEAALQDAIGSLVAGKTVLIIAHRLSTIVGADEILVLDAGRIVQRGRHDALAAESGLYAQLWRDFNVAAALPLQEHGGPAQGGAT